MKALACELPATLGLLLSRLSIAADVRATRAALGLSGAHQRQHGLALAARGRDFQAKAGRTLYLYERWQGQPLHLMSSAVERVVRTQKECVNIS